MQPDAPDLGVQQPAQDRDLQTQKQLQDPTLGQNYYKTVLS